MIVLSPVSFFRTINAPVVGKLIRDHSRKLRQQITSPVSLHAVKPKTKSARTPSTPQGNGSTFRSAGVHSPNAASGSYTPSAMRRKGKCSGMPSIFYIRGVTRMGTVTKGKPKAAGAVEIIQYFD